MEKMEFECYTLSPLDGRYGFIKDELKEYFSEYENKLLSLQTI